MYVLLQYCRITIVDGGQQLPNGQTVIHPLPHLEDTSPGIRFILFQYTVVFF